MIRKKALRKIFRTTLSLFIITVVYTLSNINNKDTLNVNLELEDVTNLTNSYVYLLNNEGYLVRKKIFIDNDDMIDKIKKTLNYLKTSKNKKYSSSLTGLLPYNTKILEVTYDEYYVTINFSREFKDASNIDLLVSSIVHSIYALGDIKGISIVVEGEALEKYPYVLTKEIDINREVDVIKRNDISKVVIYYLLKDNEETYYVPVTKYLNDSREKIAIIVDELASNTSPDLVSLVNSNVELLSSREDNDTLILNFNNFLFDNNDEVLEEVLYCISYSVFDNYDVSTVMLEVNGKNIFKMTK